MAYSQNRERSAFDINGSFDSSHASVLSSVAVPQDKQQEVQPDAEIIHPVNPVDEDPLVDAPDKSAEPSHDSSMLNDTFCRQFDPAELAFQRD